MKVSNSTTRFVLTLAVGLVLAVSYQVLLDWAMDKTDEVLEKCFPDEETKVANKEEKK